MAQFSLDGLVLPHPDLYDGVEEWAQALTSQLQVQLSEALTTISDNAEDPGSGGGATIPINDSSARPIVTADGLIVYDGSGIAVINENIVNIDTSHLADAAITTAKLADLSVDTEKLAALSVEAAQLADSSVTSTKIANLAVGSAAIALAAIGTAHIANAAITSALIGDAEIVTAKIADLAVTSAKVVDLSANKITTGVLSTSLLNLDGIGLVNNAGELTIGTIATSSVSGISGSGVNLVTAGLDTFSTDASDTFIDDNLTYGGGAGSATRSVVRSVFDGQSVLVSHDGTNDYCFFSTGTSIENIPIEGGKSYIVSCYIWPTTVPDTNTRLRVRKGDDNLYLTTDVTSQLTAGQWNRVYGLVTLPSTTELVNLSVWANHSSSVDIWYDGFMIEEYPGSDTDPNPSVFAASGGGATRNTGNLANLDTVGTSQVDDDAITNVKIAGGLSASKITTGTLDASLATITNINASNITTGALNASLITTGTLSAARIDLDGITLQNNGGVLEVSTIDWSTNIGGADKPDDNATDGATAGPGGNLTSYYAAGSGLLASANTTRSVTSSTYTLVKTFGIAGSGTVTFEFDRYSDNDAIGGEDPAAIQWRQGANVLATQSSVFGNGTWISNVSQDVTLNNATDDVDIYMKNDEAGRTIQIRNVDLLATIGNGESVVTD